VPVIEPGPPAEFRLAVVEGDAAGVRSLPGDPTELGEAAAGVPAPQLALRMDAPRDIRVILATGLCATEIQVDAAPAGAGDDPPAGARLALLRTAFEPARHDLAFLFPAVGDWGFRIVVRYWGAPGTDARLAEAWFRVRVGGGPFGTPTPSQPVAPRRSRAGPERAGRRRRDLSSGGPTWSGVGPMTTCRSSLRARDLSS
jgi:hypothetical protein